MNAGIFVSGTDTNVGKTLISALIITALRENRIPARYFKPIQTGVATNPKSDAQDPNDDTTTVAELSGTPVAERIEPVYTFRMPAAPSLAARAEGSEIDLELISKRWRSFSGACHVVEGAGGLLTPVSRGVTIRDLVCVLEIPLLIVSSTRLGTLNHTLLTVEAAEKAGIRILGIVLSGNEEAGLKQSLSEQTAVPVLGHVPVLDKVNPENVRMAARHVFPRTLLREFFHD